MQVVTSLAEMRSLCRDLHRTHTVGLVPTMGALHEGHLSLVRASKQSCSCTVATIFVNPLQFGANEDLDKYPRTFEQDCVKLQNEGVDILFAPTHAEMYPEPTQTWVELPALGNRLDGASRPGHFRGVATVVSKLFHIVQPHRTFFGQKDAAQVAVLRRMVHDLNFDLELIVCPIIRDADGLALSSRNRYLSESERESALALSRSLQQVEHAFHAGHRSVDALRTALLEALQTSPLRIDYAAFVDPDTLEDVTHLGPHTLVAVAAWAGDTRLIDNTMLATTEAAG